LITSFQVSNPNTTAYSPDGRLLAFEVSGGGTIKLIDSTSARQIRNIRGHKGSLHTLAFNPDGKQIAAASADAVYVWDLSSGLIVLNIEAKTAWGRSVAFSPDGKTLATAFWDYERSKTTADGSTSTYGEIRLWSTDTGKELRSFRDSKSIASIVFSPDGRTIASWSSDENSNKDDETVRFWRVDSGELISKGRGGVNIRSLTFTENGSYVVVNAGSRYSDSHSKVLSGRTGNLVLTILGFSESAWLAFTPDGQYVGTQGSSNRIAWRIGTTVYDPDQFFDRFYNPDLISTVLQGSATNAEYSLAKGIAPPPEVKITSPLAGQNFSKENIEIIVEAKDVGGGIDQVRLYQNGKLVKPGERGVGGIKPAVESILTVKYQVSLLEGDNVFRAVSFSRDRTASRPFELVVKLDAPAKVATLHVLVVGINQFKNTALNLNFAAPDAKAIADYFSERGRDLFRDVDVVSLYNTNATKAMILEAFADLQRKADPHDVAVLYLAGHGDMAGPDWYFIPYEVVHPEIKENVVMGGISSTALAEAVTGIRSQKVLILLDACKSGSALVAFRGYEDRKVFEQLTRSTGVHLIAASTGEQQAAEARELGHGLFTWLVLKGLNGDAAIESVDNRVTVRSLLAYVEGQLPEASQKYAAQKQYPVSSSKGMDFPLAITRK
jgi:hypothetical protein